MLGHIIGEVPQGCPSQHACPVCHNTKPQPELTGAGARHAARAGAVLLPGGRVRRRARGGAPEPGRAHPAPIRLPHAAVLGRLVRALTTRSRLHGPDCQTHPVPQSCDSLIVHTCSPPSLTLNMCRWNNLPSECLIMVLTLLSDEPHLPTRIFLAASGTSVPRLARLCRPERAARAC